MNPTTIFVDVCTNLIFRILLFFACMVVGSAVGGIPPGVIPWSLTIPVNFILCPALIITLVIGLRTDSTRWLILSNLAGFTTCLVIAMFFMGLHL